MTTVASHSAPEREACFLMSMNRRQTGRGAFARPKTPKNTLAVSPETAFDTYQTAVSACAGRIHR
jgi:hypothetical protein